MGLLGSIAGQVLGSLSGGASGSNADLMGAIGALVSNPETGGLQGLISAFEQGGLSEVVASWVGTGQNLPISAEQLQAVLGSEQAQAIAQKLGIAPTDALHHLAQFLPQVVDKLTPDGTVPDSPGLDGLLGLLKGIPG